MKNSATTRGKSILVVLCKIECIAGLYKVNDFKFVNFIMGNVIYRGCSGQLEKYGLD